MPVVDHLNSTQPFEDKPWPGVDTVADSPHRGNLYVAWTRFDTYGSKDPADKSHIVFSRSRDGGQTFSVPIRVSDTPGDAQDSDDTVEGAVPAIGRSIPPTGRSTWSSTTGGASRERSPA